MSRIKIPFAREAVRSRNRYRPIPEAWLTEWRAYPPSDRWRGGDSCLLCGAALRDAKTAVWVHMTTAGELASRDEDLPDDEDQGYFAVGPECARKVPAKYRIVR